MTTRVTAGMQYTRNLGNFENVRVNLEVTDDVRDGETVYAATERILSFVEKRVQDKVREIDEEAGKVNVER